MNRESLVQVEGKGVCFNPPAWDNTSNLHGPLFLCTKRGLVDRYAAIFKECQCAKMMSEEMHMSSIKRPAVNHHGRPDASFQGEFPKLSMLPLVALIFYEVSGGPFGVEDSVKAGGPLLALLGFLVFPFLWSIPEALVTAELATAFPENGGYVLWISAAFGPFWGFQEGFWKWFSGVMDNALYPLLFLDYLKHSVPLVGFGSARMLALLVITFCLTYLNYRGLTIVGYMAVGLAFFSLVPFMAVGLLALPRIKPKQWLASDLKRTNWRGFLNSLFWNLNFWDKASTLAGEVEKPRETFPKALLAAVVLVIFSYLVPLLAGTGALTLNQSEWEDGYFAEVAMVIGGTWLKWWIQAAAALSNMGLFEAEMSSDSFQLLGMSERGMLPEIFAYRSRYGTPVYSILCSATGVIALSWMRFQEVVETPKAISNPFEYDMGDSDVHSTICLQHIKKKRWLRFSERADMPYSDFEQELSCCTESEQKEHSVTSMGLLMDRDNELNHFE
ncbi:hypothetical protein GOP47_0009409 [Adiantum capillus-veneris]|uniref:Uncharacterized protein n=1 Tax=Adiantum capillus-veneris TaxID=13818 RepID=A0A9D4UXG1_ADICA|nr:hypothetical protein GOP47_0009409 [Adiantum capillus-veneris]